MLNKIVDYEIVFDCSPSQVNDIVGVMIEEGWQPYGNPYESCFGPDIYMTCQAMVKYEEDQGPLSELPKAHWYKI